MPEITEDDPVPHPSMPIPPERRPGFWNGNRPLIILMMLMLGSLIVLGVVTVISVRGLVSSDRPALTAVLPQAVNGANIDPKAAEDTVHPGDTITLTAAKFNRTNGDVLVLRVAELVRQDGDTRLQVGISPPTQPRPPGPSTYEATVRIPDSIEPGLWRVEGTDIVLSSKVGTLHVYSETFRVVAKGE